VNEARDLVAPRPISLRRDRPQPDQHILEYTGGAAGGLDEYSRSSADQLMISIRNRRHLSGSASN